MASVNENEVLLLWRALMAFRSRPRPACRAHGRPARSPCPLFPECPRWQGPDDYLAAMEESLEEIERRRAGSQAGAVPVEAGVIAGSWTTPRVRPSAHPGRSSRSGTREPRPCPAPLTQSGSTTGRSRRQGMPYGRCGVAAAISSRRLYLATRSPRAGAPDFRCPHPVPTARSAMNVSSVSPERWETNCR